MAEVAMSVLTKTFEANRAIGDTLPAVLLLGGAINGFTVRIIESWQLAGASSIFFGISPFELIAIAVAAMLYLEQLNDNNAQLSVSKIELGIPETLFLAAILIPSSAASWLATLLYAAFHASRTQNNERTAALLFVALSLCAIWSSIIMKWIAIPVTSFEASIVWSVISTFRPDLTLDGNIIGIPDGHRIVLLIACTTAYGLPKALLGFTAISIFLGTQITSRFKIGMILAALFYAFANLVRLVVMTWSDDAFHIAHGPIGTNIFDAATTLFIFLAAFLISEKRI